VTVSIDQRYEPIYRDARVEIRPNTPLQDMYVDIVSRGTRAAGPVRDGGQLAAAQTETTTYNELTYDAVGAAVSGHTYRTWDWGYVFYDNSAASYASSGVTF
jgi:hypothetical protein